MAEKKVTEKTETKKEAIKLSETFAVIATGGKQYIVREGEFLNIEKLDGDHKEGGKIEFPEVLLIDDGKTTAVGEPTISGKKVVAEFVQNGRDKKIEVIRFRSKSRYFKNRGHRQPYTRVKIVKIG
ncbi:50S ribosomal protein L21 [Candidatus Kaiserbacteria bacterium]|nr:MAG: 50S ribosomal protein L21 [Candidatus Kaiserbacteria bacterium]PCI90365.1 MAG: 50S ribosomal protein L21 [Candidatus Kaiserbacteria bacterium]